MKTFCLNSLVLSSLLGASFVYAENMNGMGIMENMPVTDQIEKETHHSSGVVKKVDVEKGLVSIAHDPVASLHWPAMTMAFAVKDKKLFAVLVEGKTVEFAFVQAREAPTIVSAK